MHSNEVAARDQARSNNPNRSILRQNPLGAIEKLNETLMNAFQQSNRVW